MYYYLVFNCKHLYYYCTNVLKTMMIKFNEIKANMCLKSMHLSYYFFQWFWLNKHLKNMLTELCSIFRCFSMICLTSTEPPPLYFQQQKFNFRKVTFRTFNPYSYYSQRTWSNCRTGLQAWKRNCKSMKNYFMLQILLIGSI